MKSSTWVLAAVLVMVGHQSFAQGAKSAAPADRGARADYVVTERGPHHRVVAWAVADTNEFGETIVRTNSYTELATGLHYQDTNGVWVESREAIEILPKGGGAVAQHGQHKVFFPPDIYDGTIQMQLPDGQWLRSRVLGLSYYDATSGKSVLIAETTNSIGELHGSNVVIYPEAFTDFRASLRLTYTRAGFEQDIILLEQPPSPKEWGMNPETTGLQVLTEFFDPPQPAQRKQSVTDSKGVSLMDQILDFSGGMQMGFGKAFSLEAGLPEGEIPVTKQWLKLEGRDFLVEEVKVNAIEKGLEMLPKGASLFGVTNVMRAARVGNPALPARRQARATGKAMRMAQSQLPQQGFVLDYTTVNTSQANYTFRGDTTYYLSAPVTLSGTTTFEGGAVIKYAVNAKLSLVAGAPINCKSSAYRPIIFTAKDDHTVGEPVGNGTLGGYYANPALSLLGYGGSVTLSNFRISHAKEAVTGTSLGLTLNHGQIVNCQFGVSIGNSSPTYLRNILFAKWGTSTDGAAAVRLSYANALAEHCTFDGVLPAPPNYAPAFLLLPYGGPPSAMTFSLVNCILANVGVYSPANAGAMSGDHNGFYSSMTPTFGTNPHFPSGGANPFQTIGAGNYYLATNPNGTDATGFRNAAGGSVDTTLANDLKSRTTYPPLAYSGTAATLSSRNLGDLDTPDLGYHYAPLDYSISGLNGSFTFNNGVAVAIRGAMGFYGGAVISVGTPKIRNQFTVYTSVQEQSMAWGGNMSATYLFNAWASGTQFRFTDLSLSGSAGFSPSASASFSVTDCSLHGVKFVYSSGNGGTLRFANNIIERCYLQFLYCGGPYWGEFYNNLFLSSANFGIGQACGSFGQNFTIKNNLFLDSSFTYGAGTPPQISNNGFFNTPSQGANPVTISAPLDFAPGALGPYYYPTTGGHLSLLIDAGAGTPAQGGLYHYTVKTSPNSREGFDRVQTMDIGFHYVATDASGNPMDTDADGLADYFEDTNGNGGYGTGDTGDFVNADSDGDGLPDNYEITSTLTSPTTTDTGSTGTTDGYKDSDGDGLTNLEESKLGKNPLVPDVAVPKFSPIGGDYVITPGQSLPVTVTCPTAVVDMHYTLDGSEPNNVTSPTVASGSTVQVLSTQTLKAKAWKTGWTPSDTESQGYRINDTANNPPTLTVSPSGSINLLASDSIEFLVEADDSDGTIAKVHLYRRDVSGNDYKVAETTSSVLRYTVANVPAGTYTFTAKAIDNQGAVTLNPVPPASPITLTIAASGPVVSLVGAQPFYTASPGTLLANITGVNPTALTALTLNGVAIPKRTGEFALNAALVEGANTFTLMANGTAQASTTVYLDTIAPVIAITSPASGTTINTTRVNVSGTFTESSLKQITVNGVPAFTSGNTFTALNVPLATGANAIIATAEDVAGNTKTATINIPGATTLVDPVQLASSTVGGFATLGVTFTPTLSPSIPGTVQQVQYDVTGDNNIFQTGNTYNYTVAREYFPVVTVTTTVGSFSSLGGWNSTTADRLRINVQIAPQQVGSAIPITDPVDLKVAADGHLYILSRSAAIIYEYDATPTFVRSVTIPGTTPTPTGLDVDANGNVYVAISGQNKVAKYQHAPGTGNLQLDTTFGSSGFIGASGTGNGQFSTPYDVAVSPDGTEIAVSDSGNHRIQRFNIADNSGSFLGTFGSSGSGVGQFNTPKGLIYDGLGYLYIVDSGNNRVVLASGSSIIGTSGSAGNANLGVGTRGIYVAEGANNRVLVYDPVKSGHGVSPTPFTTRLELSGQFSPALNQPRTIAAIPDFLEERIYIADNYNGGRVLKVTLPESTAPVATWNAMKAALLAGNIDQAMPYFSSATAEDYRRSFISIGTTTLPSVMNKTVLPSVINGDNAQYYFEEKDTIIPGQTLTFPVEFVKENGVWKILEF
ncbi:MAG: hypothetical protein U1F83_01180 [Verrucomicrobiota bacterium]